MIKLKDLLETSYGDVVSLFESPLKLNRPYDPSGLSSIGKNQLFTDVVIEKGNNIGKFDEYDLYEYIVGDNIFNILILRGYTEGFFQYKIIGNIVEEVGVWQSPVSLGLCRNFIFNYLLKKYDGFLSDDSHTELGKKYWDKLLKKALELNYKIYLVEKEDKILLNSIDDIDKFYFNSPNGLNYRFLIER